MNITEKVAYIKGLLEGLKLDASKPEVKVINAVVDLLDDVTLEVSDIKEKLADFVEQLDEIDEDLGILEEDFYDLDEDEDLFYELTCPDCGEKVCVYDYMLDEDDINCPNCGKHLELNLDDIYEDQTCECDESCNCDHK
ncbi:MAG: hypothetical protein IJ758_00950 [Clostridia bacterium]|nr:hypothetical protein [Clostridia bacterium]